MTMASTQRSNIEVFFRVLGAQRVQKSFRDLEAAAGRSALAVPRVGFGLADNLARRSVSAISSVVRNLGGIVPAVSAGMSALRGLYVGLQRTAIGATAVATAVGGIGFAFRGIYESTAELTSVVLALRAVNNEVNKATGLPRFSADSSGSGLMDLMSGSARRSARDLQFLNKVADEHGISIQSLGKDYASLKASTIGSTVNLKDVARVTEAIADAALVLGRTPSEVHRANISLGQIASKSQLYAEELKGQLAEAIPGAIPIAAKSYGLTVKEFNKLVEKGQVDAATFFRNFSRQLKKEYGDAAKAASNTTRVASGRLANAWFNAKVAIGSGELDQAFLRILKAATKLFQTLTRDKSFQRFGSNLARSLNLLTARFENAVNGGYDFERILNFIAKGFDGLVRGVNLVLDVIGNLSRAFANLREFSKGFGLELPSLSQGIRNVFAGFEEFTAALQENRWSNNGYVNFFLGLYDVIDAVVRAIARLIFPASFLNDSLTLADRFNLAGRWLNQLALAIQSFSTGKIADGLDETGQGILVELIYAYDKLRLLKAEIKEVIALISGQAAPKTADFATKQRFAVRDKIFDLFAGRKNEAKVDENGNELLSEKSFDVLFKARDLLVSLIEYLDENKGRLKDFFEGALSAMEAALDIGKGIAAVFKEMGIDANVAYLAGFLYIMNKILPIGKILSFIFGAIAVKVGMTTLQLGVFLVAAALVAFMIGKIVNNWGLMRDEIGNILTLLSSGFKIAVAEAMRSLAKLVKGIPLIGDRLASKLNSGATSLDKSAVAAAEAAAKASEAAAAERARKNGGVDPFADGAKSAFDGKAFREGFGLFLKDVFSGDLPTGPLAPVVIGGQSMAAILDASKQNDPIKKAGEQAAAKRDEMTPIEKQLFDSFNKPGDPKGQVAETFGKPVKIYLYEGVELDLRGKVEDSQKFEDLAARTAKNRSGQTPAWTG